MGQNNRIDILTLKEIDIASLLFFIRHIKDAIREALFIFFEAIFQRQIFLFEILKEHCVLDLLLKLLILEATVLDKGRNIIPILLIVLTIRLAHTGQFFRNLLRDIGADLLDKAVILQSRT